MTLFSDDLIVILAAAGVGVGGTTLFASSSATLPTTNGPFLHVHETGGTAPEFIHNQALPALYRPSAQLMVTAGDDSTRTLPGAYEAAMDMARKAYDAVAAIGNEVIGSTFYLSITPTQEPFDMGVDNTGRAKVAFNVAAVRR